MGKRKRGASFLKADEKNIYISKKGLSSVVATLAIILLALVAVGILWTVISNVVKTSSEQIDLGRFTLDLDIERVTVQDEDVTVVVVRRNPGEGEFVGMNFVFSNGTDSETIREDVSLEELEEEEFTFTLRKISTLTLESISVFPIYKLSSGKESVGDVADKVEITENMKEGITESPVTNFEALGYEGAERVEYGPFSSDEPKLPEFKKAIVDPLDVLPGDNQTFTVHVYSPHGVVNVTSTTELDNSTSNLIFEKKNEYVKDNETIENWSVTWTVEDVHTTTYRTNITAEDSAGNLNYVTLTWTDSCQSQLTHGTTETLSTSCSTGIDTVGGLDGGSLTIASGVTLTIDSGATWGFNSGQSITVNGTIVVNGEISKTELYYTDYDGDGYASHTTLKTSSVDAVRAKDAFGTNDCNNWASDVYPGNSNWYTSQISYCEFDVCYFDQGWDYNCNGATEYRWPLSTACLKQSTQPFDAYITNTECGNSGTLYLTDCSTLTNTQRCH